MVDSRVQTDDERKMVDPRVQTDDEDIKTRRHSTPRSWTSGAPGQGSPASPGGRAAMAVYPRKRGVIWRRHSVGSTESVRNPWTPGRPSIQGFRIEPGGHQRKAAPASPMPERLQSGSEAYGRQDLTDKSPLHPSCIVQHTLKRPL
eukprot:717859-Prorocentrum_minimum.AAC.1